MNKFKTIVFVGLAMWLILIGIHCFRNGDYQDDGSTWPKDTMQSVEVYLPPDTSQIRQSQKAELIRYGREIIVNTRKFLGPEGSVDHMSNQLNCQNCHLDAGAKPDAYSANFMGVAANYPLYRDRSGVVETIQFRVNDCMMRSMNGKVLDTSGKVMRAIVAYILWLGKDVPPKVKPLNARIEQLPYLTRAADTSKGKLVFTAKCQLCHGANGNGGYSVDSSLYYPPLWGAGSFNTSAGMFRISRLAGFVKNNMPFGVSHGKSQLSNEECWDVAAYINSQPRPHKNFPNDWPDVSKKAIDHPFGPYADTFSEQQHKYGPFEPIVNERKKKLK